MQLSFLLLSLSLSKPLNPFDSFGLNLQSIFSRTAETQRTHREANKCSMRLVKINKQMQEKLMFFFPNRTNLKSLYRSIGTSLRLETVKKGRVEANAQMCRICCLRFFRPDVLPPLHSHTLQIKDVNAANANLTHTSENAIV